jgi:hypothetical protein
VRALPEGIVHISEHISEVLARRFLARLGDRGERARIAARLRPGITGGTPSIGGAGALESGFEMRPADGANRPPASPSYVLFPGHEGHDNECTR